MVNGDECAAVGDIRGESVTRTPAQGKQDTPQQKQYKVQHQEKTKNSKQQSP
jgi:hypothetical protein